MARFHRTKDHSFKRCEAAVGNCPLGGESGRENHYDSILEARQAYEIERQGDTIPAAVKRGVQPAEATVESVTPAEVNSEATPAKLGLRELSQAAKTTDDHDVIMDALERGSDTTMGALASNPNLTSNELMAARIRVKNPKFLKRLLEHPNYDVANMSADDFALALPSDSWSKRAQAMWSSDSISMEHVLATGRVSVEAMDNHNNKIDNAALSEWIDTKGSSYRTMAVVRGRYHVDPSTVELSRFDNVEMHSVVDRSTDPAFLDTLAVRAADEDAKRLLAQIAANPHLPESAGHTIAQFIATRPDSLGESEISAGLHVYDRFGSEGPGKALLGKNPVFDHYAKIKSMDHNFAGGLYKELLRPEQTPQGRSTKRVINFDVHKVRAMGMEDAIDTLVRYHRGNWLYGATYNPQNGVYTGYID